MNKVFVSIVAIIIAAFSVLIPSRAFALAKFNTSYQIYYLVQPNGNTHVAFSVKQANNLSVVYATDYGISINETKVSNVKVSDEGVPIRPDVIKTLNQTSISFPFANKVVGKDKIHSFVIEYDTSDITSKFGNTWQINIPRLEADENVSDQTAILSVPDGFPIPAYIDPKPDIINGNNYYFNSTNLSNKSISAIFGTTQYYKGKLTYHLTNDSPDKIRTEIAIPPETSYQTIFIDSINPKPESVKRDNDGNILAKYVLDPHQNTDIDLNMYFKINFLPSITSGGFVDKYISQNKIWNFNNSVFNTVELNNLKTPKSIFDFVSDKMNYDYAKISQKRTEFTSASDSFRNFQSAICTDFTNVYIALARKAGIPTREIEGYAISDNPDLKPLSLSQDILHAWPEYFDKVKNTWIQVDPTWTNTTRGVDYFNKLDFNHITFVIHGEDPTYPVPAGGYKNASIKTKDILIEPTSEITFPKPNISVNFDRQEKDNLLFIVKNTSGVTYKGNANISGNDYIQTTEQSINISPFSTNEIWVKINKSPFINKNNIPVIISINGDKFDQSVTIFSTGNQVAIFSGIGVLLGVIAIFAWSLHLRRQKQKPSLYR